MDLGAYINIENLEELVASKNGISVPRVRGYRLMENEEPIDASKIKDIEKDIKIEVCEHLIERSWSSGHWYRMDKTTERNKRRYMTYHIEYNNTSKKRIVFDGIRWDHIHGKHRKMLKLEIKQKTKAMKKQYDLWNSYCGRSDVLYIHARIGGNNWLYYEGDATVANKPWFLGRADDYYDCTYCDIYAKIEETTND